MKKFSSIIIVILLFITLIACESDKNLRIEGLQEIELGYTESYKVFLGNEEIAPEDLYWTISDRTVLLCNDNEIMPLKEGKCDITAVLKTNGEKVAKLTVNVIDAKVKKIEIVGKDIVFINDILNLDYKIDPIEAGNKIVWSSSDDSIATVDESGCVTGIKKGEVLITASVGKAVATKLLKVKEIITEITASMPNEIVVGQGVEMNFNIDDPVVSIKNDVNKEYAEIIGNKIFAKKEGNISLIVKSKSQPSLTNTFGLSIVANKSNTIEYEVENKYEISKYLNVLSITQKLGQYMLAQTSLNDMKEDADGIYFNDTRTGVISKIYLNDFWDGREIANFSYAAFDNRGPLNSLEYLPKISKYNSQIGGINMIQDTTIDSLNFLSSRITNKGLGKLSKLDFVNYQTNLAKELKELGVNTYLTYGFDTKSNSFDKDVVQNNYYSSLLIEAFKEQGIMVGFGFDYGYGEVSDFSHEKDVLIQMVNNNVDMISIVNNIENFDGDKTVIQYLRNVLNYKGIIYYDYSFYEYDDVSIIANNVIKAINEGADLYYAPVYINGAKNTYSYNYNDYVFDAYDAILDAYENGTIKESTILSSTARLLEKKIKYNMIDGTLPASELSDYTEYSNYAHSLFKQTYDISSSTYQPLKKDAKTYVFGTSFNRGDWRTGRKNYDFAKTMANKLNSLHYSEVINHSSFGKNYQEVFNSVETDAQVIIYIRSDYCSVSYKETVNIDGDYVVVTKYDSFSWSDIISGLYARGVKNITICIENDEGMVNQYDYLTNVINANGNITQDYAALIDVALDGK